MQLVLDIDAREDDETDHRECEAEGNERKPKTRKVRRESKDEKHDCARDVWCDSVEICFDGGEIECFDDNREEQGH